METEKYRKLAIDIAELFGEGYVHGNGRVEAYEPAEFQMGLELALAMYFVAMFPRELEEVLGMHKISLERVVAEVESKNHKDDTLDMTGFTL